MDTIETLQFNQGQLRLIQIALNHLVKTGQINLADCKNIMPINEKLEEKIKPVKEETANSVVETPKV